MYFVDNNNSLAILGQHKGEQPLEEEIGVLRIDMPESAGALSFEQLDACSEAGRRAAERELDGVFDRMGLAFCRVLPFRGQHV